MSQSASIVVERSQASFDHAPLPDGWQWMRLKNLGNIADGDWILTSDYATSGVRLIQVGDIGKGRFVGKSSRHITLERAKELNCTFLQARDILISRMPDPMGRACMMPALEYPCITAVDVSIWRPNDDEADREYLTHYLNSSEWYARVSGLASGATRQRISRLNLENLSVPLPSLSEQKRIASILNEQVTAVERARAAAEAQLKAAKELPTAYLREVFESPEAQQWQRKQLTEVCKISTGTTPSRSVPEYFGHGTSWVTPGDFDGSIYIGEGRQFVTPLGIKEGRARVFPPKTVLLVCIGATIGKVAVAAEYISANQQINSLQCDDFLYPEFLYFHLRYDRADFVAAAASATLPIINQERLGARKVPLPPLDEQKRIAERLREQVKEVDQICVLLQNQLDTINRLPATLLRQAFTGKL